MRPWLIGLFGVGAFVFLPACGPTLRDLVGEQMTRETGCPTDDVDVVASETDETRYEARGCGESVAYFMHCEGRSSSSCVAIRDAAR